MDLSSCVHLEGLKQKGGIRDYEKVLLNICILCPPHLQRTRENLGIPVGQTRIKCSFENCTSARGDWNTFVCLHCIFIYCKQHAHTHFTLNQHPLGCCMWDGALFCSACDDYMFDVSFEGMRETVQNGRSTLGGNITHFAKLHQEAKPNVFNISPQATVGLRGLVNLKNTCYMNSIVQVLTHTPILVDFFLSESPHVQCDQPHDGKPCLMDCFGNIFNSFYNREKEALMMPSLLEKLWLNAPHLAAADQQDAHEFFTAILEILGRHFYSEDQPSIIDSIFQGTFKSTVTCLSCGSKSVTVEPFMDISLEVFGEGALSLEECLKRYTHVEELGPSHTINCTGCGVKKESSKQLLIQNVPLVLSMHFKRFVHVTANKWEELIKFPINLDLNPFNCEDDDDDVPELPDAVMVEGEEEALPKGLNKLEQFKNDMFYSLYAVVCHLGSSEGGHYISYIRNSRSSWFKCNDHLVTTASLHEVLNSQAYMLFYHRSLIPQP